MLNDDLVFAPENTDNLRKEKPWVLLIVDDDSEVHSFTKLALSHFTYENREIEFLSAYNTQEAIEFFELRSDIAIVLLDVVMETETAGLDLVKVIRERFLNDKVRIVIRTGQPGMAPARYVINHYDINDYHEKTELDSDRLYITVRSSLSQYKHIMELDKKSSDLLQEKRLFKTIIDIAPARIFWKDQNGVYLGCNKAFLNDAGLNDERDIIGKTDYDLVWNEDAERFREDDRRVRESGIPELNFLERQPQKDGKELMLSTSKVPLVGADGAAIGILGLYQDITEEFQRKRELKEAEELLHIQSRQAAMGELLSMIAHQWRQPLTSISMLVNTIQLQQAMGESTEETIMEQLTGITGQIQYLSQTITDFRNFFKQDKEKQLVDSSKLIHHALALIGKLLENSHIDVRLSLGSSKSFYTYPNELQHVLINIIKNAADALVEQDSSEKWISISCEGDDESIIFRIADNGGGIDEVLIHKIFEPYFSTKHEKNGTGLGLYISKSIIEKHLKGRLNCVNSGEGALFTVTLPMQF